MGKLYAISDLHLGHPLNVGAWRQLAPHPNDGLIIGGDVGERAEHLRTAFSIATSRFKKVFWVPGNHELYSIAPIASSMADPSAVKVDAYRGVAKYEACVELARTYGVLTPEDEFMTWDYSEEGEEEQGKESKKAVICPIFTLYDYSFRPPDVSRERALDWALEENVQATDEALLHPDPYPTRDAWCAALVSTAESRLERAVSESGGLPLVVINHWPLREDLVHIPLVPRFSLWCGTRATESWHERFGAKVVVTGHLHVRRTDWMGDTRFEEVSLGYPRQWEAAREHGLGVNEMLREILPGPKKPDTPPETRWRRFG